MIQDNNKIQDDSQSLQMAVSGSVTLISMVDFVLEESTNKYVAKNFSGFTDIANNKKLSYENILRYAKFLKQHLELWMFVPCDEKGNVLEEKSIFNTTDEDYIFDSEAFDNYKKAKERVLFEGFEFQDANEDYPMPFVYLKDDITLYPETFDERDKVEDLVYYSDFIKLSKTSTDIIGLTDSCLTDR